MAIYDISGTAGAYSELKTAIATESELTLLNDDGADDLTFSHTSLDVYIRLYNFDSTFPEVWIGNGWTSGANPDNQIKISSIGNGAFTGTWIIDADYMIFRFYATSGYCTYTVISKLENGKVVCFGLVGTNTTYGAAVKGYNLTNMIPIEPLYNSGGQAVVIDKYMTTDLYMKNASSIVEVNADNTPSKVVGFKCLMKSASVASTNIEVVGTDIILHGSKDSSGAAKDNFCILGEGLYV